MVLHDEVTALEARFLAAYRRGDADGAADVYTEDATYLTPGKPAIRGRSAIAAITAEDISSDLKIESLVPFQIEQADDLAYVLENCSTNMGPAVTMLVLRRDQAGAWRICAEAVVPS